MTALNRSHLLLVVACLVVSACWIDFSSIHACHNADTFVMSLVSIHKWTPLFWEQDRLGVLFPLLAMPWKHPLHNLLVQYALTTFCGLASFFLLGYYLLGRTRGIAVGALGCICLVACLDMPQRFAFLINVHHFATSAAFGLLGLILLERWNERTWPAKASGVVCLLTAHWINPGLAVALVPLILLRGLCFRGLRDDFDRLDVARGAPVPPTAPGPDRSDSQQRPGRWYSGHRLTRDELRSLAVIGGALALAMIMSRSAPVRQNYRLMWPGDWWTCGRWMLQSLHQEFGRTWFAACDAAAVVALATWCCRSGRSAARYSLVVAMTLAVVAAVQFVFMSGLNHVRDCHSTRHMLLAVFFAQASPLSFAVVQFWAVVGRWRWSRGLPTALCVGMVLIVAIALGRPGIDVVRSGIDQSAGGYTDDILAADCTHITGEYWHVWNAMFHINMRMADAGSPRRVWGICHRSDPTRPQWEKVPRSQMRIAEIVGDEGPSRNYRKRYDLLRVTAGPQRGRIRVLYPTLTRQDASQVAGQATPNAR